MKKPIKINDRITVGGQPTETELQDLAQQGYKTIVNLRTPNEEDQPLSPDDERKVAEQLDMRYVHIPVSRENMNEQQVAEFREQLARLPGPFFVHCATGKRSGAFAMMHAAQEQGLSGDETLHRAEQMGFECDNPKLSDFVKNYVDRTRSTDTGASRVSGRAVAGQKS